MVKIQLHGGKESVTINAMIDSGATEDFIDREVCNKHGMKIIKAKNPREINLAEGKPSAMGPVTIGNWRPSKWQTAKNMRSSAGYHG